MPIPKDHVILFLQSPLCPFLHMFTTPVGFQCHWVFYLATSSLGTIQGVFTPFMGPHSIMGSCHVWTLPTTQASTGNLCCVVLGSAQYDIWYSSLFFRGRALQQHSNTADVLKLGCWIDWYFLFCRRSTRTQMHTKKGTAFSNKGRGKETLPVMNGRCQAQLQMVR